jgi:hypothetical protein
MTFGPCLGVSIGVRFEEAVGAMARPHVREGIFMSQKEPSGWAVGWTFFAMVMMFMLGCWWIFAGIIGIFDDTFYVKGANYVF